MHEDLLRGFISACKPTEPVSPDDPRHFDFDAPELRLRGAPCRERLATVIRLSAGPSAQLVTGLRGSGKTTELCQLQKNLTAMHYHVVRADAGLWIGDTRPIEPEDLMLALVLSLYPDGDREPTKGWMREYVGKAQKYLRSEAGLAGDVVGIRRQLTSDESAFERAAQKLRDREGLRSDVHSLLAAAAEASRKEGEELVILLDGAEKRACGELYACDRRAEFQDHWFGAFILHGRDLRPPVHVVYTVPPFMVRRSAQIAAHFGSELRILPMVRTYDRSSHVDELGVDAMARALFRRIPAEHFVDEVTPRWLATRCGGYFRDLLRFVNEMVYIVGDAQRFTRELAERAVARIRETYLVTLVREEKDVLAQVHTSKVLPDQESARRSLDGLMQGHKMFRYHGEQVWYDAHPLCWSELGFADALPTWEQVEAIESRLEPE